MTSLPSAPRRVTVPDLLSWSGSPLVATTAYDATTAAIADDGGVDLLLVGDSLAGVVQGEETTLPVTIDQMVYHTRCVARVVKRALVIGDLPFLSYHCSIEEAVRNSGRLLKEGGAQAVKLEGGIVMAPTIRRLVELDIPVIAHVGLTPQSIHRMGGYRRQGTDRAGSRSANLVFDDARAVAEAGASAVVLECIPEELAAAITEALDIPTIGIGSGPFCRGQILVLHDLLGLTRRPPPFAQVFTDLGEQGRQGVAAYASAVRAGEFPASGKGRVAAATGGVS